MAVTRRKAASSEQPILQAPRVGDAKNATAAAAAAVGPVIPLPTPSPPLSNVGTPYSKPIADDQLFVSQLDHHVATESLEKQVRRAVQVLLDKSPQKFTSRELADAVGRQAAPNPSVLATKLNIYFRNYGRKVVTYDQGDAYVLLRRSNVDQLKRRRFVYWMEDAKSLLASYEQHQVKFADASAENTFSGTHVDVPHTPPTPPTSQEPDVPQLSPTSALGSEQISFDGSEMETPPPLSPASPPRPKYAYTPPTRNFAKSMPPVQIQATSLFEHSDLSAQDLLNQVNADDWDWVWENDEMVDEFRHPEQTSILELEKMLDL